MDALQKPEADLGLELPSLLEWRQVEEGKVDHVVLGRGKPGGIWQVSIYWDWSYMSICALYVACGIGKGQVRRYLADG